MKKPNLFSLLLILFLVSSTQTDCNRIKKKTKDAINKTGETVGKGASEFFDGMAEGVNQSFACRVEFSDELKARGLGYGKIRINSGPDASDNILSIYLSFEEAYSGDLQVSVKDQSGAEYGRSQASIAAKKGEARFVDFVFDKRTDIETRSVFSFR